MIRPGRGSVAPVSSFELDPVSTKPFAVSPSVPGHGNVEAARLTQVDLQAFATKSNATLDPAAVGVGVGPVAVGVGVLVGPPGVAVGPETLISIHQGLLPCAPRPNRAPLAFLNIQ